MKNRRPTKINLFLLRLKVYRQWILEVYRQNIRASVEYRIAFVMQVFGMAINNLGFILVWYIFFQIFGEINGWKFKEMIGLEGMTAAAYGIVLIFGRGMRNLSEKITGGKLDNFLLQPKRVFINILTSEMSVPAFGDLSQGLICLIIYFFINDFRPSLAVLFVVMTLASAMVLLGFMVITQSIAFWIPKSEQLSEMLWNVMLGGALFPGSAMQGGVKFMLMFIVPALFVGSIPIQAVLDLDWTWILGTLLMGVVWLLLSRWFFYRGLKRYESGNLVVTSM